MEPPWEGGTKVCINGPGHINKMAALLINGKNLKNLLQNPKLVILKLGMQHWGIKFFKHNDDPRLTLTFLRQGQIWSPVCLNGQNCYKVIKCEKFAVNYQIIRFIFENILTPGDCLPLPQGYKHVYIIFKHLFLLNHNQSQILCGAFWEEGT